MAMLYFVFQREAFYTLVDFSLILRFRCDAPRLESIGRQQVVESEPLPNMRSHVLVHFNQFLQKGDQLQQLVVILIHEPALYGNPIGQLIGKGLR